MYVNAQKCFNEDLGCVKEIQSEMFKILYRINVLLLTNSVYMLEKLFFISFGLTECITLFRL